MRISTPRGLAHRWLRTQRSAILVMMLSLATARGASAAPSGDIEGYVLAMDSGDVVVDIGKARGAAVGDVVELWRPLKLKHPVTGKMIVDRFRIGALRLVQVRDQLSLAQPDGALARPVAAGDVVILHGAVPLLAPPTPSTSGPLGPPSASGPLGAPSAAPSSDAEADALAALFDSLHGATIDRRIEAYDTFVRQHPTSRFRKTLEDEAAALRTIFKQAAGAQPSTAHGGAMSLSFDAPKEIIEGAAITIAIEIVGEVSGAVLQLRVADETAYTPIPMKNAGARYFRVTLPKERVRSPHVSYFIEAVLPNGSAVAVEGSSAAPRTTKVIDAPKIAAPPKWLSTAAVWTDYSDYNRLRRDDWAWQTEGFFGMRFGDVGLRALRSGFGVYKGKGGSLIELDGDKEGNGRKTPRSVGLSYGYVEAEWGFLPSFGIAGRAIVGLTEEGVTGGAQGFVRIGNDRKTNLIIGGEFLGGIGIRAITQFELKVFPRIPIMFRSEVTNQPAGVDPSPARSLALSQGGVAIGTADLGVRAIAQVGFRATRAPEGAAKDAVGVTFFVRGSYQGRTINHAGPGFGGGAQVEW